MSFYAIGDLHLSLDGKKPMDIFGEEWKNHYQKIEKGFSRVGEDDTVLLCGDLSWGMSLDGSRLDFDFIAALPGKKILLKGNHDYWWTTAKKMKNFFVESGWVDFEILHNNCVMYGDTAICGSRGWFFEENFGEPADEKVYKRELLRLEASLECGKNASEIIAFLHYPPVFGNNFVCEDIVELLERYGVKRCCYAHLHGAARRHAFERELRGIDFKLISGDHLGFVPVKIL